LIEGGHGIGLVRRPKGRAPNRAPFREGNWGVNARDSRRRRETERLSRDLKGGSGKVRKSFLHVFVKKREKSLLARR